MKTRIRKYCNGSILLGLILILSCSSDDYRTGFLAIKEFPDRQEDFSMWQLDQFHGEVQMGYILRTDDGNIIVVDGGLGQFSGIIEKYISKLGKHVHTWLITHPHKDHAGVLMETIKKKKIKIDRIIHSELNLELVEKYEPQALEFIKEYQDILSASGILVIDAKLGDNYMLGKGVELNILGVRNETILINMVNNSSLVFKIKSSSKSVLFLGDLGVQGGNTVLSNFSVEQVKSDYVQMAHHGQDGVDKSFYEAVSPQYAMWPTPGWLWENNLEGKGFNSGTWKTLSVRDWMQDLKITRNYVAGLEGTIQLD